MKFSVFTDLHHYPGVFDGGTEADLRFVEKRAQDENVNFIIHVGDFCHGPSSCSDYVKLYNNLSIKTYHCLGNHDTDETSYEETLKYYNMPEGHYFFDNGGYRFIICDPNYFLLDGKYIHYSLGNYYNYKKLRDYMPPQQLKWLEKTIDESPYPCVIFSHESFEREANGVKNLNEVRKIINDANNKKRHSVIMCINGHYHRNFLRILDNVCYLDLNSASYDWIEKAHGFYPEEQCKMYKLMPNTLVYKEPIHAIISLEGTTISIKGMKTEMFMGVQIDDTENDRCDLAGRLMIPEVLSEKITLS